MVRIWDGTKAGIEELAAGYNGLALPLDEIMARGGAMTQIAQDVTTFIYQFASNQARTRSTGYISVTPTWRTICISNGEHSLEEIASLSGNKRLKGEMVRFQDIPAVVNEELGIYESLPEDVESSSAMARLLDQNTQLYYGTPLVAFLTQFCRELEEDRHEVIGWLHKRMDYFLSYHRVDRNDGTRVRTAKRFAAAYAAGRLAIKYGILPFTSKEVGQRISWCYWKALETQDSLAHSQLDQARKRVERILAGKGVVDLRVFDPAQVEDASRNPVGYRSTLKGQEVVYVHTGTFRKLCSDSSEVEAAMLQELERKAVLARNADGRKARLFSIPGKPDRVRGYCLRLDE